MDKAREVRFLYPPLITVGITLLGIWSDGSRSEAVTGFVNKPPAEAATVLVEGGTAVVIAGFILGTVVYTALKFSAFIWKYFRRRPDCYSHEAILDKVTNEKMWEIVTPGVQYREVDVYYALVTFDCDILGKGSHEWILRHWNSFNVSINSAVEMIFADLLLWHYGVHPSWRWCLLNAVVVLAFIFNAITAWCETMDMFQFAIRRLSAARAHKSV